MTRQSEIEREIGDKMMTLLGQQVERRSWILDFDEPMMLLRDPICWNCHARPRMMVFPKSGGSYWSVRCEECACAPQVLARLEKTS